MGRLVTHLLKVNLLRRERLRDVLSLTIIFGIIFAFGILLQVYKDNKLNTYVKGDYDLIIQAFNERQLTELVRQPFIEKAVPFYHIRDLTLSSRDTGTGVTIVGLDDLADAEFTWFSSRMRIKGEAPGTRSRTDGDPRIAINREIAKHLGLGPGDRAELRLGSAGTLSYTVATVYESVHHSLGENLVVIETTPELLEYLEALDPELPLYYHMLFIKASDYEQAKRYLAGYPMGQLIDHALRLEGIAPSDSGYEAAYREKEREYTQQPIDRREQLRIQETYLEITPSIITVITVIGFLLFFIFLYRENARKLNRDLKTVAILASMGMRKITYALYLWTETLIYQIPIFLGSVLLTKVIYQYFIPNLYISATVLRDMVVLFLALQLLAGALSAAALYRVLLRKPLHLLLTAE